MYGDQHNAEISPKKDVGTLGIYITKFLPFRMFSAQFLLSGMKKNSFWNFETIKNNLIIVFNSCLLIRHFIFNYMAYF